MITFEIKGVKELTSRLKRMEIQIPKVTQEIMHETGLIGKEKATGVIRLSDRITTSKLIRSIHFMSTPRFARLWTDSPIAIYNEFDTKKHYIYRTMISPEGYSVEDWMNMKIGHPIWRMKVGGKGLHFMQQAYFEMRMQLPRIISRWEKQL